METEYINNRIAIRPLEVSDYEALSAIADERLGTGYFDYADFVFRTEHPRLNLVAVDDGRPAALISMTPEAPESLARAVRMDLDTLLRDAGGRPVIHFRTALCDSAHDGQGISGILLEKVISNARELGYGVIISPTWMYNGIAPAEKLQTNLGFRAIGKRKLLWYGQEGYSCVICGGPCRCDAVLLELIL